MKRVAITGASGMIGAAFAQSLRAQGVQVLRVGRSADSDVQWDIAAGTLRADALEGLDAVVHLAGAPIARRWTVARKNDIRESRVQGTALLSRTLAALTRPPRVFLSGSAIGIYGDRNGELLTESSLRGAGFLANVTSEWEHATAPAATAGIAVVHLRTGLVLSKAGGVLAKMLLPFRLGLGGTIGGGRQWMSWIGMADYVRAVEFLIEQGKPGPVNLVGPSPVTGAEFVRTLAHVLRRPALFPVPALALRLVFGEMARETILASQRVQPDRLLADGFSFEEPDLAGALRRELR